MNNSMKRWLCLSVAALAMLITAGCAAPHKRLYEWGGYQGQVYDHLRGQGKGPEQQIIELEKDLEEAGASGATVPPGFYAHLGLLYMTVGKGDQAVQLWNKEKSLFPESSQYIDFLLNNMKKQGS